MKILKVWLVILAILVLLSVILGLVLKDMLASFKAVFGIVFFLFVPGYCVTLAFFRDSVDTLERITLSVAFSIAIVPLIAIGANKLLGVPLNAWALVLEVFIVSAIMLVIAYLGTKSKSRPEKKRIKKRRRR